MRDLRLERLDVAILIDRTSPDMRVEVAIRAFGQAERPMDVDPETRVESRREETGHAGLMARAVPPENVRKRDGSDTSVPATARSHDAPH